MKILTEFKVSFKIIEIVRKMILFLIIWMTVNLRVIPLVTYRQPWCQIASVTLITGLETATIPGDINLEINNTKSTVNLRINTTNLNNCTLILMKIKKSIILTRSKNKSSFNKTLCPQLATKKLRMMKFREKSRPWDCQRSQSINKFLKLLLILQNGNFNRIWLQTYEASPTKVKLLRSYKSTLSALIY